MPTQNLPLLDEHGLALGPGAGDTWCALLATLQRAFRDSECTARLLGCDTVRGSAQFSGRIGDTVPGFRVVAAEAERRLVLRGRHRFAHYELEVEIDAARIRARSYVAWLGLRGRLYRAAVVGSGGHRFAVRRILRRVVAARNAARVESAP